MGKVRFILTGTHWLGLLALFVTLKLQAADSLSFNPTTVTIDFNNIGQNVMQGSISTAFQSNVSLFGGGGIQTCNLKLKSAIPNPQEVLIPGEPGNGFTSTSFRSGWRIGFSTTRTFASTLTTDLRIICIYEMGTATATVTLIIKKIGSAPTPVPPTGFKPGYVRVSVIVHYSGARGININCVPGSTIFPTYRRTSRADRLWLRMGNRR